LMRTQAWPTFIKKLFLVDRAIYRLVVLFSAALLLSLLITDNSAVAEVLFQSPPSPVEAQPAQPQSGEPFQQPAGQPQVVEGVSPVSPVSPLPGQPATAKPLPTLAPRPQSHQTTPAAGEKAQSPNFIFDQAEFVDTVVVSVAYVWLCCGVVLILLIPLAFLFLHIRGRSKINRDEQF